MVAFIRIIHREQKVTQKRVTPILAFIVSFAPLIKIWMTVAPPNFICLSVCLFVYLSVGSFPLFKAFISATMGLVLMKLGGSVRN